MEPIRPLTADIFIDGQNPERQSSLNEEGLNLLTEYQRNTGCITYRILKNVMNDFLVRITVKENVNWVSLKVN